MDTENSIKEKALEFFKKQQVIIISTVATSGEPESAAVSFIVDDEFNIYIATRESSRKFQNIAHDPRVSIVAGFDPKHLSTLQIQGTAEVSKKDFLSIGMSLVEKSVKEKTDWWPLVKMAGLDFVVIKVKINWMRWLDFDITSKTESYKEYYHQVI